MKKFISISYSLLIVALFIFVMMSTVSPAHALPHIENTTTPKIDTVKSLDEMTVDEAIWFHNGEYIHVANMDADEEGEEEEVADKRSSCPEPFSGSARAAAKTSFDTSAYTVFRNIDSLRLALPTDAVMQNSGLSSNSPRSAKEQTNVNISTVKLYAIKRESDEDYHMVFGTTVDQTTLILAEVSGLPATNSPAYSAIKTARDSITNYFGTDFCGSSSYKVFSSGIPVSFLRGSIFYDIDHSPGTTGPTGYRPNTSWEIHPIHDIAFRTFTGMNAPAKSAGNSFKIYPNPTAGNLFIENLGASSPNAMVSIYSTDGKLMASLSADIDGKLSLPLGFLGNGIYILKIQTAQSLFIEKFIKD